MKIIVNISSGPDQGKFWSEHEGEWQEALRFATFYGEGEPPDIPYDGEIVDLDVVEALVNRYEQEIEDAK